MPIYNLNNRKFNIPDEVVNDFERDNPDATIAYNANGNIYDIPVNKKQGFLQKYPNATLYDDVPQINGEVVNNTISGGVGTQEEADSLFELNAARFNEKDPNKRAALDMQYNQFEDSLKEKQDQQLRNQLENSGEIRRLQEVQGKAQLEIDKSSFFDRFFNAETRAAVAARDAAEEALETYSEANQKNDGWFDKNVGGALRGFFDKVGDLRTWDFGASGVSSAVALKDASEKLERGEALTPAEQNMLDAYGLSAAVQAAYQNKVGTAYRVGGSLPESLAFGASLALNPAGGVGKKIAETAAKAAVKKYGTGLVSKLAKGAARVGGDIVEMGVATAIPGAGRVAEDYYNRLNGQSTFDVDNNGIIRYGGQVDQEEADDAIWKAFGSQFIENYSESMGNYFAPMGTMLSNLTSKGLKAGGLGKLAEAVSDISSSQWSKGLQRFKDAVKFDGLVGEYLEEVAGNFMNAATVGDMNFNSPEDPNSVFNPDTNIETFLSCALLSGTMYAVEAPITLYNKHTAKKNLRNADNTASSLLGNRWEDLRNQIDSASPEHLAQILTGVQNAEDFNDEQKQAVKLYASRLMQSQGFNARNVQNAQETTTETNEAQNAYNEGSENDAPQYVFKANRERVKAGNALKAVDENVASVIDTALETGESIEPFLNGLDENVANLARDYYNKSLRMRGVIDGVMDRAEDAIAEEEKIIRSVTDPSTGMYTEINRLVTNPQTGEREAQPGYVVGWIGDGENRMPTFLPEGVENIPENRIPLKPTEFDKESIERLPMDDVISINAEMIRERAKKDLNDKASMAEQVYNYVPKNEDQVIGADGQVLTITGVTPDGIVYISEQGNVNQMSLDEWKGLMQAQLDAQEQIAAEEQATSPEVIEETQPTEEADIKENLTTESSDNLSPVEEVAQQQVEVKPQTPVIPTKEDGSIDFVSYGKEGTFKTLGEKYGEKMPNKVAVTAKALAEDLKKAQNKLQKAEEAYDNAPIGREQKAEEARDKAKQELEAIQREANFWAEMDAEIKDAQARRESMLNPQAEVETSTEPMNVDEFVAQQLASGNIVLDKEDYKKETGYGDVEANAMNGGATKLFGKNGMTIQEAGERLMEIDRENGTNFFDQLDSNSGRDALINVLGSVKSRKELNQYIASNRSEQAKKESEGLRNELEKQAMEANYASLEDYVLQMEVEEMENPFLNDRADEIMAIFAEEAAKYEQSLNNTENGQGTENEVVEGNDSILPEEQLDNTGGTEVSEESERIGDGTSEESESAHAATEVELKQEEGETTLQFAERAAEENRRRPLRKRAEEWSNTLGIKVTYLESIDDVDADTRREIEAAHANGKSVPGWVNKKGEVFFFMPDLSDLKDVDDTYIHEVVAHVGLPQLLGKERFGELCDKVWEMMPQSAKDYYISYPGVKNHRDAADEYIAHLAEQQNLTPEEKTIWDNIVKMFREMLDKALNGIISKSKLTDEDISNLIKASYANLKSGAEGVSGEGTRFRTLEEVNQTFNEYLQKQIDGVLPQGYVYSLGNASDILRSAGIPYLPIEMASSRLSNKSNQENHPFELSEITDLPKAIQNPLAVFDSATRIGSNVILTELKQGNKNFVVAIETNRRQGKIYVNSVRSIHPRTTNNIVNWINEGLLGYANKETLKEWLDEKIKTKDYLNSSNPADVRKSLVSAANIVKDFQNPTLPEEKTSFRVVTDKNLIDKLESEPKIKVYRAMQLIDGKLYPPMSAKVDGKMREPIELGKWEMAEERPDLADEKGYFKLDKGNKSSLKARYNPYIHTSTTPLNDQFSSAQSRPELVTVEVEIPESELTSGYKAEKAKDAVGKVEWKAGVVQGKLSGTRTVILSRYDKPIRIVPDSEVADEIVKMFDGKDITMPSNVVTPSLRAELEKRGVPFVETDNQGKAVGPRFRVVKDKNGNKSLVGLHNISEAKLKKAIKQGGLANPSVAVIDMDKQSHVDYGDITLVAPSSLVDKKTGKNIGTYTADAWTPIYPQVEKQMSKPGAKEYSKELEQVPSELRSKVRLYFNAYLEDGNTSGALNYWFLHDTGKNPPLLTSQSNDYTNEELDAIEAISNAGYYSGLNEEEKQKVLELFIEKQGGKDVFEKNIADRIETMKKNLQRPDIKLFIKKKVEQTLQGIEEYGYDYEQVSNFYANAQRAINNRGKIDEFRTFRNAQDIVNNEGLQGEFDKWLSEKEEQFGVEEYLFVGYNNNGDRKYLPNTLENASKLMKKEGRAGATGLHGFNHFVATLAPNAGTLAQINKKKGNLSTQEEYDAFREKWGDVYHELANQLQPDATGYADYGYYRLEEMPTVKNPKEYVKKEYGIELSDEFMKKYNEFVSAIKNDFPARYFETKFERPVYLNEFAAAVIPQGTSEEVVSALTEAGLPVEEYERGNDEARMAAVDKVTIDNEGVRFRVKSFETANEELIKDGISINNKELMDEYGLSDITLSKSGNHVTLSKVVVKDKGQGNGTRFMEDLTNNADNNGWILALTPDTSFGGSSVARLKKFYKRFGFKENKGRNTDFETRESMVRPVGGTRFRVVYHGSAANFDKFDRNFSGSGEGQAVMGAGHYVTTSEGTGRYYAEVASDMRRKVVQEGGYTYNGKVVRSRNLVDAYEALKKNEFDVDKAIESIEHRIAVIRRVKGDKANTTNAEEAIRLLNEEKANKGTLGYQEEIIEKPGRYLYEVEIPDDNGKNYFDLEKKATKKTKDEAKKRLYAALNESEEAEFWKKNHDIVEDEWRYNVNTSEATNDSVRATMEQFLTQEEVADILSEMGYVGSKSKATDGITYIIYNDDSLEIKSNTRFRLSEKGKQIQAEVDKFTSKYNSKPVRIVEAEMDDNELMDALDYAFELEDVKSFMKESKTAAGYFHNLDKIIIFADKTKVERMEEYLFHENIHAAIHHNNFANLVAHFYEYAKNEAVFEKWSKLAHNKEYKQYNSSEEFLAYVVSNAMVARNLDEVAEYLGDKQKKALNKLFNVIGYDYDIRRRSDEQSVNGRTSEETSGESSLEGNELLNTGEGRGTENGTGKGKSGKVSATERKARLNELFNKVADMGLQGVLGNKEYTSLMVDIYKALPEEVRAEIAEDALRLYGGSVAPAVSDYIGPKSKNSIMDKVVTIVREALRKIGFDLDLNANEVRYMAWRSKKPLDRNNMFEVAEDIDMKYRLKVGEYDGTTPDGGGTRFRRVYHGSGASFDKFDHSFMGTGEGNQSFGWGTYVTDVKAVGEKYAGLKADNSPIAAQTLRWLDENSTYENFVTKGEGARRKKTIENAREFLEDMKKDGASEDVIKAYEQDLKDAERAITEDGYNQTKENMVASLNRHLYEVEIPDDNGSNYIAWDKMLPKEQAERIKDAIRNSKFFKEYEKDYGRLAEERLDAWTRTNGGRVYKLLGNIVWNEKDLSQILSEAGFAGFKYPTNYFSGGNEDGTNNYVIFNEKDLEIKEHTRFRVANKLQVRDEYEATIKKGGYQAREAVQDAMLSLRKFQELIEKASGKKIRDFENAWMHENRLSSVVQAEIHDMERKFYKPMMDAVKKLMKVANLEQEQVADYLMLKHGIERNREMAVRKALTDDKGKIDRTRLEQWYQDKRNVRNRAATPHLDTWRKQQEELDNIALLYGADMSRDYSGLTSMFDTDDLDDSTQKAYDEVEALENAHPVETESLGKAIKAMTQNTLDKSFESGLMDRKVYDELSKDMYDYYIPLRGFEETTSEEVYAYLDQDRGAFNAPLKRAKGRSSKSDNPIAYLKSIAESGIMQGNRNKMKQSFLNMVINHPSDLVSVREGVWVIYNPATGEWEAASAPAIPNNATPADVEAAMEAWEQQMEQAAQNDPNIKKVSEAADVPYRVVGNRIDQHQIIVKRLGKSYTLTINGNPRLAMAINGQTNPNNTSNDGKVAAFVNNKIGSINRSLAAWYTTRNPDFVASNFMRDTFYTNTIVRAKEGNAYANKFHKNYATVLPKMLGLFRKYENGTLNPADQTEAAFLDFMMNGGETGYSNLKDVEEIKKQISKALKESKWDKAVTAVGLKALRRENVEALAEKLDILNRAVENTARFAAFLTSREEGRSIAKSVFDAKEISVNFNKKGAGGTFFGMTGQTKFGNLAAMVGAGGRALYVFFNAAVQGTTNLMHVMKVNPKGTSAGIAAMFLMGAVIPFLFEDDDEKDYYDLPEHVRRNHLIIPGTGDAWISIPLPIEYRIMYGMGELLTSWRTGHERGSDIARKMLSMSGQALPLNFLEEGLEAFVPSAVSPIYQVMTNSSWTGLPIYKENDFNKDDPEYTKAYSNVDRNLLKFTKALYEWSFDEENQKERIDLNPAIIETLAKGYFGGLATQLSNIAKVGGMIAGEQEFDWRNIPIGNRILKTGDERTKEKRVTNEYFENMEKLDFLQSRERMLKKAEKGVAVPEADKFKAQKDLETMQGTEVYKKYQEFKKQKKVVDKIRKTIKEKGSTPEREKQLMEAQEKANKSVR